MEDLVNFVTKAKYEDELEVVLDQIAVNFVVFKDDRLSLSRLRAAWHAADTTLKNLEQRSISGDSVDGAEGPLDPDTVDTLQTQWDTRYHVRSHLFH